MGKSKFDDIYHELGLITNKGENSLLKNLTAVPPKEPRNMMPHTTASKIFATEQLDTLYLPQDGQYKYLLVIVDIASRICDCEPMKNRDAPTTVKALEKIFKRGIVKRPKRLEVDSGSEFKGAFETHFRKFCKIVRKLSGRSRQQSVVENKNQQIGKIVNAKMTAEEINNDVTSKDWVKILPKVVQLLNQHFSHPVKEVDMSVPPKSNKFSRDILPIGTSVRVQLDKPIDYVEEKRLHGKFRTGDIRWTKHIGKITRFFIRPDQPVMYQVDDNKNVAYTKYQLQVVKPNEVKPSSKTQVRHYAQEITSQRNVKGKIYYKIRWEDGDITEQDRAQVLEELPELLKEFKEKNKK
jgi:hypothetical protein